MVLLDQLAAVRARAGPGFQVSEHLDQHADDILEPGVALQRPRRHCHKVEHLHHKLGISVCGFECCKLDAKNVLS